jgi:hypothetical protein
MENPVYTIDLPESNNYAVFVNSIHAKTLRGTLWLWRHMINIRNHARKADGCFDIRSGLYATFRDTVTVSYWEDIDKLYAFFHDPKHQTWLHYIKSHSKHFDAANEIYLPPQGGKYINGPMGFAVVCPRSVKDVGES